LEKSLNVIRCGWVTPMGDGEVRSQICQLCWRGWCYKVGSRVPI